MAVRFGFDACIAGTMCCAPPIDSLTHFNWRWNCVQLCLERPSAKWHLPRKNIMKVVACMNWKTTEWEISRKFISKNSRSNSQKRKLDIAHWIFNYFHLSWWILNCGANLYFCLQESTSSGVMCAKNGVFDELFDPFVRQATGFVSKNNK